MESDEELQSRQVNSMSWHPALSRIALVRLSVEPVLSPFSEFSPAEAA